MFFDSQPEHVLTQVKASCCTSGPPCIVDGIKGEIKKNFEAEMKRAMLTRKSQGFSSLDKARESEGTLVEMRHNQHSYLDAGLESSGPATMHLTWFVVAVFGVLLGGYTVVHRYTSDRARAIKQPEERVCLSKPNDHFVTAKKTSST
jgi:hypothetical protein